MKVRSMTGFARVSRQVHGRECAVSVKSVNHKALDIQLHLSAAAEALENEVRKCVREWVGRGYVQVSVQTGRGSGAGGLQLNEALFQSWVAAYQRASTLLSQPAEPEVEAALRVPGMLVEEENGEAGALGKDLLAMLEEALRQHRDFREREGAAILDDLRSRCALIGEQAEMVRGLRGEASAYFQNRLKQRLEELLGGNGVDPQRMAQEVALLTDKTDISEELTRLLVHVEELRQLLEAGGELGKKLDFLLQEMNREANTLLAKTANAGEFGLRITSAGITMKSEIEKMREQALNLE